MDESRVWVVKGRVQGVGFRWFAVRQAEALGLVGWVRNQDDGSVEVVARGPATAIEQMEEALRRGPSGARVSHVESTQIQHELVDAKSFSVKY